MMEFFLSKVWVFIVSAALLVILVQGVGMKAQAERTDALEEVRDDLQEMLGSMNAAGPGLDQTILMRSVLSDTSMLTVHPGYLVLGSGEEHLTFDAPIKHVRVQLVNGTVIEVSSVQVLPDDSMRMVTDAEGLTITVLSQRTSVTGT